MLDDDNPKPLTSMACFRDPNKLTNDIEPISIKEIKI